ncbi:MAG: winged helix-turn-helix transcriptional regulator [Bacilli bacterium]|nr:winged helix-turn-helix transcriptional regulator [Bacilli bacterium]
MGKKESLFKPSPLYRELALLNAISDNPNATQRDIALIADVSATMINKYLDKYEAEGLITKNYSSSKTIEYFITKKGIERRKLLAIQFLESSLDIYNLAKDQCSNFLKEIVNKNYQNVLFYGAGEVAEIMVYVITNTPDLDVNVLAIIDDDESKIGTKLVNIPIISSADISKYSYDGILVSSYGHSKTILSKLKELGVPKEKTLKFFEGANI